MIEEYISKHFLHPKIKFSDHDAGIKDFGDFTDAITFWKTILVEKYGLTKGSKVAIFDTSLRFNYITLVLAAAELGIVLILTPDKPTSNTGKSEKLDALVEQHGMIDLCIMDDMCMAQLPLVAAAKLYGLALVNSNIFDTYTIKDHSLYNQLKETILAGPDDVLVLTTTSGSTGEPKLIAYTHRQLYKIGKRNVSVYQYDTAVTCHTRNMHHAFVLLCHFLPVLTGTEMHYTKSWNNDAKDLVELVDYVNTNKINSVVVSYKQMLDSIFLVMIERNLTFLHDVTLIVGGFYITKDYVDKIKKVNVKKIISTFGSNETLAPLLLRHVDQNTDTESYQANYLGKPCDDFYQMSLGDDGRLQVTCKELFDGQITMDDRFSGDSKNGYYHQGRENFYRIDHTDFSLSQVNDIAKQFATGEFNITIDIPYQRIYLTVWSGTVLIDDLNSSLHNRIGLAISSWDTLDPKEFNDEFKLNHDKLRHYYRQKEKLI